jgi:lipid-A-disaccharide synthase
VAEAEATPFHIHVAEEAHRRGIPVFYYISPQVWASRPGRIKRLARCVKQMLVILPFEEELYRNAGVPVTFVGHPLLDMLPAAVEAAAGARPRVGLFPGSRPSAIRKHLTLLADTARKINEQVACDFVIFGVPGRSSLYEGAPFPVVIENDYAERQKLSLAITTSGTVSLENALLGIPMLVMYRLSALNYHLAKLLIRIPYITLANILLKKMLVPELIQHEATPEKLSERAVRMLQDPAELASMRRELLSLKDLLGTPGASERAARIVLGLKN